MTAQTTAPAPRKSRQVTATVSPELFDALENYRWDPKVRQKMPEVILEAVNDFVAKKGIKVSAAPVEDAQPDKA